MQSILISVTNNLQGKYIIKLEEKKTKQKNIYFR